MKWKLCSYKDQLYTLISEYQRWKGYVRGRQKHKRQAKSLIQREITHCVGGVWVWGWSICSCPLGLAASASKHSHTHRYTHTHTQNQTAADSNEAEACWAAGRLFQLVSGSLILVPQLLTRLPLFHTIHTGLHFPHYENVMQQTTEPLRV